MTSTSDPRPDRLRFSWAEFSGSLGDLGIFLPLAVGVAVVADLDFGVILVAAGVMNLASGWVFRQPIPVQPMKAIAAVAIAEGMTAGEIEAAGLLMGAILLVVALSGAAGRLHAIVPKGVVRGIQLGVGLKLAAKGATWIGELPAVAWDSILVAAITFGVLLVVITRRVPGLLYVFAAGFLLLYLETPEIYAGFGISPPAFQLHWPGGGDWSGGFLRGVLPQLPLTLLNSVIAVCVLSGDYFPGRGVPPQRMSAGVGLINLVGAPFGAIPMCYGAGGLAAQYRFGARTGGSVVMLGAMMIVVGLVLGGALLTVLEAYPMAILGTMLLFAGVQLASAVGDLREREPLIVALFTGACILGVNTWVGFVVGCAVHLALSVRTGTRSE